jgi:hypothetical protein
LDKPLHVIYKVSKLAYTISVILIANERVKKNRYTANQSFPFEVLGQGFLYNSKLQYVGMMS